MSRRRVVVRGVAPMPRIRENSRLMRSHETMVDFINGRHAPSSVLDVFAQGFLDLQIIAFFCNQLRRTLLAIRKIARLNLLRNFDGDLEDDFIYSDEDDDDDDYDDDFSSLYSPQRTLEPHPRIRQLTEEEADKHAKELIEEEERRKERTERNKRKKLRKKEKKRLEKENAAKSIISEEEQRKSDSSESQEENPKNTEVENDSAESGKAKNEPEAARCEERQADDKEKNLLKIEKKEEVGQKNLDLNNSKASTDKPPPDEKSKQRPSKERKKDKNKSAEVQESKEEKPNIVEEPEGQKIEEKHEPIKEQTIDPAAEEFERKSREFASNGNHFATAGQYEMAVQYFTSAIKYNPKEYRLFGNRSLCYERLQQYENALQDADLALCLEPRWIKGLFRKGKALCGLKRYYEASLVYREVLELEKSSDEAMKELKRAQTLQLMETGFSWAQSSEALKTHDTVEEAIEALFAGNINQIAGDASASREIPKQPCQVQENESEWTVRRKSQPRSQQVRESEALGHTRSNSQSPTPMSKNPVKPVLYSVWVGSIASSVTHSALREVFARAGTVYSVKMLLEQQCAFINYTKKEDCDRAVQCINGMVLEGSPLSVRHPDKFHTAIGSYKKECFFWRTSGCTSQDCSFRHVPENKGIDKERFKSRQGNIHM